jgi:hypothetical protein
MRLSVLATVALMAVPVVAVAQGETRTTTTETKYVTVDGDVVRYEPGRTIVIRGKDNREVTYALGAGLAIPSDVQVGRRVTLYTEPAPDGSTQLVQRVTTTSVTAEGETKRTTEETRSMPYGSGTRTTTTTTTKISGRVQAYEPGKTLTIVDGDGNRTTYFITGKSSVPAGLVVGRNVTVLPLEGSDQPTVQTITVIKTDENH